MRTKFKKNPKLTITAVQVNLDLEQPITYKKWGGVQTCKQGDWIVNGSGETYSIDKESFAKTYAEVSPGVYVKTGFVWAEAATEDGSVPTKEGHSAYAKGDFIVCNNEDGTDAYCMTAEKFNALYVPAE